MAVEGAVGAAEDGAGVGEGAGSAAARTTAMMGTTKRWPHWRVGMAAPHWLTTFMVGS